MRFPVAFVILFLVLAGRAEGMPRDWRDDDLGRAIVEGIADPENLWLRGATGKVVRFNRSSGNREIIAEDVVDLLSDDDRLWMLARRGAGNLYYVVDLLDPDSAGAIGARQRPGDRSLHPGEEAEGQVLGLVTWPGLDRPVIVSQRGWLPLSTGGRRQVFAASLGLYGSLAATDAGSLYVGYNRGEWGGGLRRVDLPGGQISFVSGEAGSPCEGIPGPACEPVVGLFPDRRTEGCVIVGTGISHLRISRGAVYRVCGSAIEPVYSTPTPAVGDQWMMRPQPWPLDGLFEVSSGWVATSRDRYFRSFGRSVEEHAMPDFRDWAGLRISDEQDGVLFLVAACCWGSANNPTLYRAIAVPVR